MSPFPHLWNAAVLVGLVCLRPQVAGVAGDSRRCSTVVAIHGTATILLVEDEKDLRHLTERTLERSRPPSGPPPTARPAQATGSDSQWRRMSPFLSPFSHPGAEGKDESCTIADGPVFD